MLRIALLLLTAAVAINGDNVMRFAFGCTGCEGLPYADRFHVMIDEVRSGLPPDVAATTTVESLIFDIGPGGGTREGLGSRKEALLDARIALLIIVPVVDLTAVVDILTEVHDAQPEFRALIYNNNLPPPNTNLDWLLHSGIRWDEVGYMVGFIAGTLTNSGRVGLRTNGAHGWSSRARANAFVVGVADACPYCVADVIASSEKDSLDYGWNDTLARGDDVYTLPGGLSRGDTLFVGATLSMNVSQRPTIIYNYYDFRIIWSSEQQNSMPYAVPHESHDLTVLMLRNMITGRVPFQGGVNLLSAAQGAMPLVGCRKQLPVLTETPCASAHVSAVQHEAILKRHRQIVQGDISTGVVANNDAFATQLSYPLLKPYMARNLSDHYGDAMVGVGSPVPLLLASYKIVLLSSPFQRMWSYVYAGNFMAHSPLPPAVVDVLAARTRFSATSLGSSSVVFGGHSSAGYHRDVVAMENACFTEAERCLVNPTARVMTIFPSAGRIDSCVVQIAPGIVFVHGGVDDEGAVYRDAWLYNITADFWVGIADSPIARQGHVCTPWAVAPSPPGSAIAGNCVVVVGGRGPRNETRSDALVYCLETDTWQRTEGLHTDGVASPCVFTANNRVYLFGGGDHNATRPSHHQLWVLTSTAVWTPSPRWGSTDHIGGNTTAMPVLPGGPMVCSAVTEILDEPHNQTVVGPEDPQAIQTMIRLYAFGLGGDRKASSSNFQIITFPWLVCDEPNVFSSVDGLWCEGAAGPAASAELAQWKLILAIVFSAVAFVALLVGLRFVLMAQRAAAGRRRLMVPTKKNVTLAAVSLRQLRPGTGAQPPTFHTAVDALHQAAQSNNVYEAQRFGDTIMYAADNPSQIMKMVTAQFDSVYNTRDAASPQFCLRVAIHAGEPRVTQHSRASVRFKGIVVKTLFAMVRLCPDHEAACTTHARKRFTPDDIAAFHASEPTAFTPARHASRSKGTPAQVPQSIEVVLLRPQCTAQLRAKTIAPKDVRHTRKNPSAVPATTTLDTSNSQSTVSSHFATAIFEAREDIAKLFLKELFNSYRMEQPNQHKALVLLASRRFSIPHSAGPRAQHGIPALVTAVVRAVVRELDAVLEAVEYARTAVSSSKGHTNPLASDTQSELVHLQFDPESDD